MDSIQRESRERIEISVWGFLCILMLGLSVVSASSFRGCRTYVPSSRTISKDNLHNLMIALDNYAEANDGYLPPAIVRDANGRALYSWRVLILPYIDRRDLYRRFRLDEPWNSEHNRKLSQARIRVFQSPQHGNRMIGGYPVASYVAVIGKRTTFPPRSSRKIGKGGIERNGHTIVLIDGGEFAVPWAAPNDPGVRAVLAHFQEKNIGPYEDSFLAGMSDGSVINIFFNERHFQERLSPANRP